MGRLTRNYWVLAALLLFLVLGAAAWSFTDQLEWQGSPWRSPSVFPPGDGQEISVDQILQRSSPVILIDVRTQAERQQDAIHPSLLIPVTEIEKGAATETFKSLTQTYQDLNLDIVLYCARGVRSARAQRILAEAGITTYSLRGGITAWRIQIPRDRDAAILAPIKVSSSQSLPSQPYVSAPPALSTGDQAAARRH
ncbi:MAG: rhodanese-like domain-containing protein [Synechococcaceae cyanobacterium SM2_3_1]|nr:rhodanese-like domain-containing protein [Synechococcaceae cyanobacterium SM2_3_1]